MAETARFADGNQLDIDQLRVQAKHRWLFDAEICEILRNYQKFSIATKPPNMPPSGSFFLFDRKAVRFFRNDGHNWRKKGDGRTVKEAQKKLKVGSSDVLHCYSAHGEENENFQRCCYWMLEEEIAHIVLVHYREVKENRTNVNHVNVAEGTTTNFHETEETMNATSLNRDKASQNEDNESDNYQGKLSVVPGADFFTPTQADKVRVANNAGLTDKPLIDLNFPCWKEILKDCEDCAQGVGSQPLHRSFSSTQTDTLENIPTQVHEILGELSSNRLGEGEELASHLLRHGELQGTTSTESVDQKAKLGYESVFDSIAKRIDESDNDTRVEILKKLSEIANMESEVRKERHDRPNSKGDTSAHGDASAFELE
ncbi:Calmodulin-binding transcription activator [Melia azedarach]|uniref:Calmodulin-binding transcription activator n=1 Tax=Melia azedarach TaxID=155640 RepID=A0ACC1XXR6_MELAZ|nr:Calmodulin-binding transcription activator [Melia azedarach]